MESLSLAAVEVAMLRHAVERLVARNDRVMASSDEWAAAASGSGEEEKGSMAAFRGPRVPRMGVGEYVERIGRYAGGAMSPSCFVVAFVLLDRAAHRRPAHPVGSRSVHRLLLTSLLLASKLLDDAHHNNAFFARVGGVSNAELNRLELELLFLLDFDLTVTPRVYESYYVHLQKEMLASGANKQKITRSPVTNGAIDEDGDFETNNQKITIDEDSDFKTNKQKIARSPMMNGAIDEDGDFETKKHKIRRSPMTNGTINEDGDFESSVERPRRWSLSPPRRSIDCC